MRKDFQGSREKERRLKDGTLRVSDMTISELRALVRQVIKAALNDEMDELWDKEQKLIDKLIKHKSPMEKFSAFMKKNWLNMTAFVLLPGIFVVSEGIKFVTMNVFSQYGVDKIVLNQLGLKKAANPLAGPCIYGASGLSAYRDINNRLADAFAQAGYDGYGYCRPVRGAVESVELVNNPDHPMNIAITQGDIPAVMNEQQSLDYAQTLLELDNMPECALIPASDAFESTADLVTAAKKAAAGERDIIRIAMRQKGSGSYVTGHYIMDRLLTPDGYNISYYEDGQAVARAVAEGLADVGVTVEYPGRIKHKFLSAMKEVADKNIALLPMDENIYKTHFADAAVGYRLLQINVKSEWSYGMQMPPVWRHGAKELPPMVCNTSVKIVGYRPDLVESESLRRDLIDRNDIIAQRINPEKLVDGLAIETKEIAAPTAP